MLGGTGLGGRRDGGTPEGMVGRWDGGDGRARGVGLLLGCGSAVVVVFLLRSDSDVLISGWLGLFCQRGPRKIGPNASIANGRTIPNHLAYSQPYFVE